MDLGGNRRIEIETQHGQVEQRQPDQRGLNPRADSAEPGAGMPRGRPAPPARPPREHGTEGDSRATCAHLAVGALLIGVGIGARGRRARPGDSGLRPARGAVARRMGSHRPTSPGTALRRPTQRASRGQAARLSELIEADPAEQRQTERDPEREPAVIGDVEHGQGAQQVVDRRPAKCSHGPEDHEPGQECDVEARGRAPRRPAEPARSRLPAPRNRRPTRSSCERRGLAPDWDDPGAGSHKHTGPPCRPRRAPGADRSPTKPAVRSGGRSRPSSWPDRNPAAGSGRPTTPGPGRFPAPTQMRARRDRAASARSQKTLASV